MVQEVGCQQMLAERQPKSAGSENDVPGMALCRMVTEAGCQQMLAGRPPKSAGSENDMPGMAL